MATMIQGALPLRNYQRPDLVAQAFGRRRGLTPNSAHQRLLRLPQEYADALASHIEAGALSRLTRFEEPAAAVRDGLPILDRKTAHLAEEKADGAQDVAYAEFSGNEHNALARQRAVNAMLEHARALVQHARAIQAEVRE